MISERLVPVCLIAAAAAAAALLALGDVLHLAGGGERESVLGEAAQYVWADGEANLWSWYSGFLLSSLALAFFALAARGTPGSRRSYLLLGGVALAMSADEVAGLHELLRHLSVHSVAVLDNWLVIGVPLAIGSGLVILRIARTIDPRLRAGLVVAGCVQLTGAVGAEAVGDLLTRGFSITDANPLLVLEVTVEEGLEITGVLLALRAVGLLLVDSVGSNPARRMLEAGRAQA